jgi:hypothetical protein
MVVAVLCGCDKKRDSTPPPRPSLTRADLPDPHTVDWDNATYQVGSLGTVKATGGRAEFRVVDDDLGLRATQVAGETSDWPGFLDVDPPLFVDLDRDGHDEAVIPFELKSAQLDDTAHVFGAFVFTMRAGMPIELGTLTAPTKQGFVIRDSTIVTPDGAVWGWDAKREQLARAPR